MTSGCPWVLGGVQGRFFIDLGVHFRGLGTSFLDRNHAPGHDFSICAFRMVPGSIFNGFVAIQGRSEPQKPLKITVLSSNFKV